VPGAVKVKLNSSPVDMVPLSHKALSLVEVCGAASLLVQFIVSPTWIVIFWGTKAKFAMLTCSVRALAHGVPVGATVAGTVALDTTVGEVTGVPQPPTLREISSTLKLMTPVPAALCSSKRSILLPPDCALTFTVTSV
jgi:hypothetical protein